MIVNRAVFTSDGAVDLRADGKCKTCRSCQKDECYYGWFCKKGAGNVTKFVERDAKNPFCPKTKN